MQPDETFLAKRWQELWQDAGIAPEHVPAVGPIFEAYRSNDRSYHNLAHIETCLNEFGHVSNLAEDPIAVELAIWLHDVIYDARRADNESKSADWAVRLLGEAGVADALRKKVIQLILATRHDAPPPTPDSALLVDIDLSILGQPEATFEAYDAAIRAEYAHVPENAYRAGRAKVLQKFLDRPSIFHLPIFRGRYEEQASRNLTRTIDRLRAV